MSFLSDIMDMDDEAKAEQTKMQKIMTSALTQMKDSDFKEVEKFYYANCDAAVDTLDGYALVNNEEVFIKHPEKEKIETGTILVKSDAIDMPNSGLFISGAAYLAEGQLLGRTVPKDKDISFLDETGILFKRKNNPKGPKIINHKLYEQGGALG